MGARVRMPQKLSARKPMMGQLTPTSRSIEKVAPPGWFQRRVARVIERAAIKAQSASTRPVYRKVVFSGNAKPTAAQKPAKPSVLKLAKPSAAQRSDRRRAA